LDYSKKNIEYNGLARNKIGLIIGLSDFMELYEQIGVLILVNGHDKLLQDCHNHSFGPFGPTNNKWTLLTNKTTHLRLCALLYHKVDFDVFKFMESYEPKEVMYCYNGLNIYCG